VEPKTDSIHRRAGRDDGRRPSLEVVTSEVVTSVTWRAQGVRASLGWPTGGSAAGQGPAPQLSRPTANQQLAGSYQRGAEIAEVSAEHQRLAALVNGWPIRVDKEAMTFASWFRKWNPIRSPGGGFETAVDRIITDLEELNGSTERDFLAVGEKLMTFRATARQVASDMAGLTELISGEHGRRASRALSEILEQTKEIDGRIERSGQAFEVVRELSGRIRLAFGGLRNTVSVFRTLCTLARIETSRLRSTGVGLADLAAEIMPLSESIQASGEGILQAASRLIEAVQSTIQNGSDLRLRQLRELPTLVSGITGSLQSWEERQRRAAESSVRHAAQYAALCEAAANPLRGEGRPRGPECSASGGLRGIDSAILAVVRGGGSFRRIDRAYGARSRQSCRAGTGYG
jgi:hypothetical protein